MRDLTIVIDEMLATIPQEDHCLRYFPIKNILEYVKEWLRFLPPEAQSAGWNMIANEMSYLWRAKKLDMVQEKLIVIFKGDGTRDASRNL